MYLVDILPLVTMVTFCRADQQIDTTGLYWIYNIPLPSYKNKICEEIINLSQEDFFFSLTNHFIFEITHYKATFWNRHTMLYNLNSFNSLNLKINHVLILSRNIKFHYQPSINSPFFCKKVSPTFLLTNLDFEYT